MFKNKSIIFLLKSFILGGAERQALAYANYLQTVHNCTVYIYAIIKTEDPVFFKEECKRLHLNNVYQISNPLSVSGKFKFLKRRIKIALFGFQLRKHKPYLIIPYLNPPSIIANLCYKIAGATYTFWHHRGMDYFRNDAIEQLAVGNTKLFIANSPNGLQELQHQFQMKKGVFLPNFKTLQKSNITIVQEKDEDRITIGMIAHFRDNKLQYLLVNAIGNLIHKFHNLHVILVGNIYENKGYEKVVKLINAHNIKDHVTIHHNTQASEILPLLDVGVLFSEIEGMPNTIMEYMEYKLPIVATNHEGCQVLLGKDYPYLVENTLEDIVEKLEKLLVDTATMKTIGEENYKKLNDNFSITEYHNKLMEILGNV